MGLSAQLAVHRTLLPALFFPRSYSFHPLYLRSFLLQLQRLWSGGRSRGLERWTLDRQPSDPVSQDSHCVGEHRIRIS
ncbi:hypothetical protein DTO280E4_2718 [Paecilomyces variotii]|nr:hypothetical protein DTO280E4_2718 [Paecilomyces variotii]KAJ9387552.1 hypothetical protein DTO063F5_3116 [Paecilomyces variotii]